MAEGRELRGYRSYKKTIRETLTFSKVDPDLLKGRHNCPQCGRSHKIFSSGVVLNDYIRFREGLQRQGGIITCESCGYKYPFVSKRVQRTVYQAGSNEERLARSKEKKEKESEEEDEEEEE